jgi:hypothetical protein
MLGGRQIGTRSGGVLFGTTASAEVYWNDDWLKQAGLRAFRSAGVKTRGVAVARAPAARVRRTISLSFFSGGAVTGLNIAGILRAGSPLAHLFELGVERHNIAPKNSLASRMSRGRSTGRNVGMSKKGRIAMKFPDGRFARGTVSHPGMAAKPFMRPAASTFPGFFRNDLRRLL